MVGPFTSSGEPEIVRQIELARAQMEGGRCAAAVELMTGVLNSPEGRDRIDLYRDLSWCFEQLGDYESALDASRKFARHRSVLTRRRSEQLIRGALNHASKAIKSHWNDFNERPTFILDGHAQELPREALAETQVVPNRNLILDDLPKQAICGEVGTLLGEFARTILTRTQPTRLHLIDIDINGFVVTAFQDETDDGTVQLHQGDSASVLAEFDDDYFDWLYIDGDHSLNGVERDLGVAHRKVKEGGWIVCNDYTVWSPLEVQPYGVLAAANDLVLRHGYQVTHLALATDGYPDIALRKPLS